MASSIPSAVHSFVSLAQRALPASSFVWFGKPLGSYTAPVTLQILGVHSGGQEVATLGPEYRREEHYEIQCLLTSWSGDTDFLARMDDVFANFGLLTVALANNPTLDGSVRFAQISTEEYVPDADGKGMTLGSLSFTVACQARITSLT